MICDQAKLPKKLKMTYTSAAYRVYLLCLKLIQSKTKSPTFPSALLCFGGIFDFDAKVERLEEVNAELEQPDVWNDPEKAKR